MPMVLPSTTLGGAVLLPWAQRLSGTSTSTQGTLSTNWNGKRLSFPAENPGNQHVGRRAFAQPWCGHREE